MRRIQNTSLDVPGTPASARVVLYEPAPVLAEALTLFLRTQQDLDAIGVSSVVELFAALAGAALVMLSIHGWGPHVIDLLQRIRAASGARVALLGLDNHPRIAALAIAAGADGYIHQRADPAAFLSAIRGIMRGETIFVGDGLVLDDAGFVLDRTPKHLTAREEQVISLVAHDLTAQQVASTLGVSVRTVHAHLYHAYKKLSVHGRMGAVFAAGRMGSGDVPIDHDRREDSF